jgi:virginiamycin A acetyltransferase
MSAKKEGTEHPILGSLLFRLYGWLPRRSFRWLVVKIVRWSEGGDFRSLTLRRIFQHYHQIEVGLYSAGGCFVPNGFRTGPPGCKIGRYCSFALTARRFNANHPTNTRSTHAVFYLPEYGYSKSDFLKRTYLTIGHDVWLGHNAVILSSVQSIGDGAIIGAGAVVHQDVPPYAIVVGNPARVVRYRFSPEMIRQIQESRWWEKTPDELLPEFEGFRQPLEGDEIR